MTFAGDAEDRIEDLKTLAKARSATEFRQCSPTWLGVGTAHEGDPAAALSAAIESIADPVFRAAATALFPLPYDTNPGSLSERRSRAAQHFNVGASTFRTPSATRVSYEERVLGAVVAQLNPDPSGFLRRHRTAALGVLALIVTLAAVAIVGLVAGRSPSGSRPGTRVANPVPDLPDAPGLRPGPEATVTLTPSAFGERVGTAAAAPPCPTVNVDPAPGRIARVQAAQVAIGRDVRLCQSTSAVEHWDMTAVEFGEFGSRESWIDIRYPDDRHLVMPNQAWKGYLKLRTQRGADGPGRPSAWRLHPDGTSELETDGGQVVVGAASALPHFYMTDAFVEAWRDRRDELGLPMSSSSSGWVDFEHGRIEVGTGSPNIAVETPEQARRALPDSSRLHNSVVRQRDGTSWFVDAQGQRWWIPDEATFMCLDGLHHSSLDQAPGAAVATLPPAGVASCEFAALYGGPGSGGPSTTNVVG